MRIVPPDEGLNGERTDKRFARTKRTPTAMRVVDGHQARVLVVDDEPTICTALSRLLALDGFDVLTAQSGARAEEVLRAERVDVLVLDLRMPDQRGDVIYHVATSLQPHLTNRTVFFTGDITTRADEIIAECRCEIIRKPENEELTTYLARLVPARRSLEVSA